jgi:hypothetical protein
MKKVYIVICLIVLFIDVNAQTTKISLKQLAKIKAANIKKAAVTQLQYFVIKADSGTYGYSIYANGNLYINQTTIPAISSNKGFADTSTAATIAKLAIQRIKQGEMPPTITIDDLRNANITKATIQKK